MDALPPKSSISEVVRLLGCVAFGSAAGGFALFTILLCFAAAFSSQSQMTTYETQIFLGWI